MPRFAFLAVLALLATPLAAQEASKSITLTLSEPEAQALAGLMDAGVKATGLRAVEAAAVLVRKLDDAIKAAQAEKPKEK